MAPPPSTPPYQHRGALAVQVAWCVPLKPSSNVMFCTTIRGYGWLTQSSVDHLPAQVSENRIRRLPPPLSVTRPPPSRTTRCLVLGTLAVAVIRIVTGFLPQLNRDDPASGDGPDHGRRGAAGRRAVADHAVRVPGAHRPAGRAAPESARRGCRTWASRSKDHASRSNGYASRSNGYAFPPVARWPPGALPQSSHPARRRPPRRQALPAQQGALVSRSRIFWA